MSCFSGLLRVCYEMIKKLFEDALRLTEWNFEQREFKPKNSLSFHFLVKNNSLLFIHFFDQNVSLSKNFCYCPLSNRSSPYIHGLNFGAITKGRIAQIKKTFISLLDIPLPTDKCHVEHLTGIASSSSCYFGAWWVGGKSRGNSS